MCRTRGQPMSRRGEKDTTGLSAEPAPCCALALGSPNVIVAFDRVADDRLAIDWWRRDGDQEERKPAHNALRRCSTPAVMPANAL